MPDASAPLRRTARSLPIALLRAREAVMVPFRDMLAASGITEQKWRVLRVLSEAGPLEQTAISTQACLSLPSLTRILTAMEADGLVRRQTDASDRRRSIVSLAGGGQALIDAHSAASNRVMDRIAQSLGEDKLETLLDLLEDVHGHAADLAQAGLDD